MYRREWIGAAISGLLLLVCGWVLLASPPGQAAPVAEPCPPGWHAVAGSDLRNFNRSMLQAVAAIGPNDVWAVGGAGRYGPYGESEMLAEHWDGLTWTRVPVGQNGTLTGLAVAGPRDLWAVGQGGVDMVHWDGRQWSPVTLPPPSPETGAVTGYSLYAIAATGPGDVWAVGSQFYAVNGRQRRLEVLTLHWDGTRWARIPVGGPAAEPLLAELYGVTAVSNEDVWAVGTSGMNDGGPISIHWDGTRWSVVPLPASTNYQWLRAVAAAGADNVWAVGGQYATNAVEPGTPPPGPTFTYPLITHWDGSRWTTITETNHIRAILNAISVRTPNDIWAVGSQGMDSQTLALHWDGLHWAAVPSPNLTPNYDSLTGVAVAGAENVWAVGYTAGSDGTLRLWYSAECGLPTPNPSVVPPLGGPPATPGPDLTATVLAAPTTLPEPILTATAVAQVSNPTARVADPHDPVQLYFPLVGHTLAPPFRAYWEAHGGLAQFGYPLTQPFTEPSATDGKYYLVQYFERNRFEYHPENAGTPYEVLLGLLGRTVTAGRENEPPFRPVSLPDGPLYFPTTGHTIGNVFHAYWQSRGGLPVYGYPISEPFTEVSPTDGLPYLVQYFERNRLEYHPELPAAYRVSLGLLGVDVLRARGMQP
jgi:hypothetical protein